MASTDLGGMLGAGTGAGLELVTSLIGHLIANGQRDQAEKLYDQMLQDANGLNVPEFEAAIDAQVQKYKDIQADPAIRDAQLGAMSKLQSIGNENGLDPQSRLALQEARQNVDQQARANQAGVQSEMQRRGMSGSGAEIAGQMQGAQSASNRGNMAGLQTAADARMRALDAIKGTGQLSSQVRGQDFAQEDANRRAAMERDMFNSKLRTAAQQSNIAQRYNQFNAANQKLNQTNKAKTNKADRWDQGANRTEKTYSGVGRGMNKLATTAGQAGDESFDMYMKYYGMGGSGGGM